MKNRFLLIIAILCLCALTIFNISCGDNNEQNNKPENSRGISFKNFDVKGTKVYGKVGNSVKEFSFMDEIIVKNNAKYIVSLDIYGTQIVVSKTVPLNVGDNTVYVTEFIDSEPINVFEVVVRRKPLYDVRFITNGGTFVKSQTVEEDSFAIEPTTITTREGYNFVKWDYSFKQPITKNTNISAIWEPHTNVKYKVEHYLQNKENDDYVLTDELNLNGTAGDFVKATVNTYENYSLDSSKSNTYNYIRGDGSLVLRLYYNVDCYSLSVDRPFAGEVLNAGCYKHGTEPFETVATEYLGYDFLGWYSGEELLSTNKTYIFDADRNVEAKFKVKEEMSNFIFDSTKDSCEITGVIDKTITELVFPDYITKIWGDAFWECDNVTSISVPFVDWDLIYGLPNNLNELIINGGEIGERTFKGCNSLTNIVIGNNVTLIGDSAFENCYNLISVIIGNNVTSIGYSAFKNCKNLTNVEIGNNVTVIGGSAFESCKKLKSIDIVNNVVKIGSCAFRWCDNLASVVIGNNVTSIGDSAFENCYNLSSLKLGNKVTEIGASAFDSCESLTSVVIPNSVNMIDSKAFYRCFTLTVYCEASSEPMYWSNDWHKLTYNTEKTCPVVWDCNNNDVANDGNIYVVIDEIRYSLKNNVAKVVRQAKGIKKAVILNEIIHKNDKYNVCEISSSAFNNCDNLSSVVVPNSLTLIDQCAFSNCTSLTNIVIPNSVSVIGTHVFNNCTLLTIYCEAQSKPIGWNSYWNYSNCPVVWGHNNIISHSEYDYVVHNGEASLTNYKGSSKDIIIPRIIDGYIVSSIGEIFSNNATVTSITIPNTIVRIGSFAFESCTSLDSVNYLGNIGEWCSILFGNYSANPLSQAKRLYIEGTIVTELIIPNTVAEIKPYAFYGCNSLTKITISESVQNIGEKAFYNCNGIEEVNIPTVAISAIQKTKLRSVIINGGTEIPDNAFKNCTYLTNVTLSNDITNIGNNAFANCISLTKVVIPNSVMKIGGFAFVDCNKLTIYCEATSKPTRWDDCWDRYHSYKDIYCPVVWGYKPE